jgi:hypothetical protein
MVLSMPIIDRGWQALIRAHELTSLMLLGARWLSDSLQRESQPVKAAGCSQPEESKW